MVRILRHFKPQTAAIMPELV